MRTFVMILGVLLALSGALSPAEKGDASTVGIITYDAKGEALRKGAGFFACREGHVVTDFHLVRGAAKAEVLTRDGRTLPVKSVLAANLDVGLVRLELDAPGDVAWTEPNTGFLNNPEPVTLPSPPGDDRTVRGKFHMYYGVTLPAWETGWPVTAEGAQIEVTGCPVVNGDGKGVGVAVVREMGGRTYAASFRFEQVALLKPGAPAPFAEWSARYGKAWEETGEGLCSLAMIAASDDHMPEALELLRKAVEKSPRNARAWAYLSYTLSRSEAGEEALGAADKAVALGADDPLAHYARASALRMLKRGREAVASLEKAVALKPDFLLGRYVMGLACWDTNRLREAFGPLDTALRLNPYDFHAQYEFGWLCNRLGRHRESARAFEMAVRSPFMRGHGVHHSLACALQNLGSQRLAHEEWLTQQRTEGGDLDQDFYAIFQPWWLTAQELGRWPEMVDICRGAMKAKPDASYPFTFLAWGYLGLGRLDDADQWWVRHIEKWDEFSQSHAGRGWVAVERAQNAEAVTHFELALRFRAHNVDALLGEGVACRNLGRLEESRGCLEKALWFEPTNASARYQLALTCLALGDRAAARAQVRPLAELDAALASGLVRRISE